MTRTRQGRRAHLVAALVLLAGCAGGGSGGGGGGGQKCVPPTDCTAAADFSGCQVRFGANIQPIFNASCAVSSGCHAGTVPAQGYDLSPGQSYAQSVNVKSQQNPQLDRVEPGKPDKSYTFLKIGGVPGAQFFGTIMPQGCPGAPLAGAACLTADQIDAISTWITECAPDN